MELKEIKPTNKITDAVRNQDNHPIIRFGLPIVGSFIPILVAHDELSREEVKNMLAAYLLAHKNFIESLTHIGDIDLHGGDLDVPLTLACANFIHPEKAYGNLKQASKIEALEPLEELLNMCVDEVMAQRIIVNTKAAM